MRRERSGARVRGSGHALLSVLVAAALTATGTVACLRATAHFTLHELAQRQRWEVAQHVQGALDVGPASGTGDNPGPTETLLALSDGTPVSLVVQRWPTTERAPERGSHFTVRAQWVNPLGKPQSLELHSYWFVGLRLY